MYRIEVAPGEVTVFRTIEELAVGIRNGVITPRARIYHHASQKWLPIGLHPHYKKALAMPTATTGATPVTTATPIPTPSRLKAHPPAHSAAHPRAQTVVHYPEPMRSPETPSAPESGPAPQSAPPPSTIPAPRPSPVIAMQHEILRDLPVVSIPEPLPWNTPVPQAVTPAVEPPRAEQPRTEPPRAEPRWTERRRVERPPAEQRATRTHAPRARHAPLEFIATAEVEAVRPHTEAPLLPRPTARRSRRMAGRPLLLLGTAAALVICTHLVLTATPSAPADWSAAPAPAAETDRPQESSEPPSTASDQPAAPPAAETPRVSIAPARVPMTPGPAFAASVATTPAADPITRPNAQTEPAPVAPAASAAATSPAGLSIAPAPEAPELALPDFQSDSVVPSARKSDTLGMKKILRALNGSRPAEPPAAE